jgi:hypothetical protein
MKRLVMILAAFSFVFVAKSSFAYFKVCDSSSSGMWIADAHYQSNVSTLSGDCDTEKISSGCYFSDWLVEGWWHLNPGQCAVTYSGALTNRYFYVHAEYDDGRIAVGPAVFSIEDPAFSWDEQATLHGSNCLEKDTAADTCDDQPYNRGFRQVDVGSNSNFTYTLTN